MLQGSRLTSFELIHDGIPHLIEPDGAASLTILRGLVDVAIIGADRIAANGDSTLDPTTATGDEIVIEQRDADEVFSVGGVPTAPAGARVFNPAFDVTPCDLILAIVTEAGVRTPSLEPA